jgi:hypothetical protein
MSNATVVRLCRFIAGALLVVWLLNLYRALTRSIIDWSDAAGMPILVTLVITLIVLQQARARVAADPTALARSRPQQLALVGMATVAAIAAFYFGFRARAS